MTRHNDLLIDHCMNLLSTTKINTATAGERSTTDSASTQQTSVDSCPHLFLFFAGVSTSLGRCRFLLGVSSRGAHLCIK